MKKYYILLFFMLLPMITAAQRYRVKAVAAERIEVTAALDAHPDKQAYEIAFPYKSHVDSVMMPVLGMSEVAMSAKRPESLLGNWVADALVEASTCKGNAKADFGLANVGGMRNNMPKGIVSSGDIFLISPFENTLVVLEMKGSDVAELMQDIAAVGGEAVSKEVRLVVSPDGKLLEAKVDGHDIEENRTYHVATLDYLAEGNDKMFALKKATGRMETGLTIREVLMENVVRHRKITSRMEGRIVIKGNE